MSEAHPKTEQSSTSNEAEVTGAIWRVMRGTATEEDCAVLARLLLKAATRS